MLTRILTAIVFLAVMFSGIYLHPWGLFALFALINVCCLIEFQDLSKLFPGNEARSLGYDKLFMGFVGTSIYSLVAGTAFDWWDSKWMLLIIPILLLFFVRALYSKAEAPFLRLFSNMFSVLWITIPCAMTVHLGMLNGVFAPSRLVAILLLIWATDTFAYLVGRKIGKTPLFKRVSPNKTWEGIIGGAVASLILGGIIAQFLTEFSLLKWLTVAAIAIIFGTQGDLIESLLKRTVNIKDSGTVLPGHGGFLDRFDALLFSVPFIYSFLYLWA